MAGIKRISRKLDARGIILLLSALFALPLGWGVFTGFTIWLSPFVMLNSVFVLKSVVWLNSLALIILVLAAWRRRWFCHQVCPVGWACDRISGSRKGRGLSIKRMPPVGKWLALSSIVAAFAGIPLFILFDPLSILNSFFVIFSQEFSVPVLLSFSGLPLVLAMNLLFPGIWCVKLCPLGGLQDEISTVKRMIFKEKEKAKKDKGLRSAGRRLFLVSGAGLLAGILLPSFIKPGKRSYLMPPGSVPGDRFSTLCLRCGNCIKSCPTGILGHHMDPLNTLLWMVPEVSFVDGYCLEDCNTCSRVCPSGAITLFARDAKSQLFIGSANIEFENCLLSENKECDRCKAACSYHAIQIEAIEGDIRRQPVVNPELCVGCGACVVICPPRVIEVVPLP